MPTNAHVILHTFVEDLDAAYQWVFRQVAFFKDLGQPTFSVSPCWWNFPIMMGGIQVGVEPKPAFRVDFQAGGGKPDGETASGMEIIGFITGEGVNEDATDDTTEGDEATDPES